MQTLPRHRKREWLLRLLALLIGLIGCGLILLRNRPDQGIEQVRASLSPEVRQVLENGSTFVLMSLDWQEEDKSVRKGVLHQTFHGHLVMGQTEIKEPEKRKEILATLFQEIGRGNPAKCFMPRHGIHAALGEKTVDLVLCFQCEQVEIYTGTSKATTLVTPKPREVFDRILTEAAVPLAD